MKETKKTKNKKRVKAGEWEQNVHGVHVPVPSFPFPCSCPHLPRGGDNAVARAPSSRLYDAYRAAAPSTSNTHVNGPVARGRSRTHTHTRARARHVMSTPSSIHSFLRLFIHSFIHSFVRFIHSFIRSFHSFIHSFVSLIH